ncbi:hypothetical protein PTKU46_85050 [Paraburkholderia terrae]|uniref:hypothetical protein n=1 Tax=Paraburkholderia terrae TaxID=311230 RepID=UPI0030E2E153
MRAHLSGSLETLIAELDASGMKLTGHARVEATPFAEVPLQRATLTFDHVNPQAFAPGAPLADLAVRAELQPVQRDAAGCGGAGCAGQRGGYRERCGCFGSRHGGEFGERDEICACGKFDERPARSERASGSI